MTWYKSNLVTLLGGYDIWQCSNCGFKKKYFGLRRETYCPKCTKKINKEVAIYGGWAAVGYSMTCQHCKARCVICPRKDHPNSRFYYLQREGESLFVCPNGCSEDGKTTGIVKIKRKRRKKRVIKRRK